MPLHRFWCFTAFNEPDRATWEGEFKEGECRPTYVIYQEELAPGTGRRHYQGYLELSRRGGVRDVQRFVGGGVHTEPARSPEEARDYCRKEESRAEGGVQYEWGQFGGRQQGSRSDIHRAAECAKKRGAAAVADEFPATFVKYHRGLEAIHRTTIRPRSTGDPPPTVVIHYGPTGTGKTRGVYEDYGSANVYTKDDSKWWDGYHGQKVVLFDDWVGSLEIPPVQLLRILDRYPIQVQTKGGYVPLNSQFFIFTSTQHFTTWYAGVHAWVSQLPAFRRRLSRYVEMVSSDEEEAVKEEHVDADAEV